MEMENFQEFTIQHNDGLFKLTFGCSNAMGRTVEKEFPLSVYQSIAYPHLSAVWGNFFAMPTDAIYHLAGHNERQLALASEPCLFTRKYISWLIFIRTCSFDCLSWPIHLDHFKWANVWYT